MRQGALVYDDTIGRYRVRYSFDEYSLGLHCGEGLEVKNKNKYVPTRIEYKYGCEHNNGYYLVGINTDELEGLIVRY